MYCPHCAFEQPEPPGTNCVSCGAALNVVVQPADTADEAASTIIPYRNIPALVGYYLAVFSLLPCAALVLGPAAVVLGIIGFSKVRKNPTAKGTAHAWTAIILGGVTTIANVVAIILINQGTF